MSDIVITKARVHNLKGINVTIPRNSLTVVTGLSGSGKSSLAFDTLYAEGQRRYVESLSAYARQFLDRMEKPDVEKIEGLSPAISIEQRTTSGNPRSIVATVTEIHDYLRILYGSVATPHCPKCGKPVTRQSAEQIVDAILRLPEELGRNACQGRGASGRSDRSDRSGRSDRSDRSDQSDANSSCPASPSRPTSQDVRLKILLLAPVVKGQKGRHEDVFAALKRNGFARVRVDGETYLLEEVPALDKKKAHSIDVVIDRLVLPCDRTRLTDSVELALKAGKGVMKVEVLGGGDKRIIESTNERIIELPNNRIVESANDRRDGEGHSKIRAFDYPIISSIISFSELNACVDCGLSFDELKPRSFSFNSPFGACPTCGGLGQLYYFDEDLVVPDRTLPLRECIHPWRRAGHNAIMYYNALLEEIAKQYGVKLDTPYEKLPAKFRHDLMHGFKEDLVLPWRSVDRPFEGVLAVLKKRLDEAEDDETRAKYEAYQSYRVCPACHGARLNEFSRAATVAGKTISEVMALPVGEAKAFFDGLKRAIGPSRGAEEGQGPGDKSDAGDLSGLSGLSDLSDARGKSDARASGLSCPSSLSSQPPPSPSSSLSRQKEISSLNLSKLAALKDILAEITRRLQFLLDVGLDYLTLDRAAATLSGGEMQRIRLATQIGSGLTGVLYVLDEPTIGLHPRDNERLIATLKGLRDRGNTVVIVEHDEEMMRAADWIIDLGPGAGREGGEVMYQGDFKGLLKAKSLTADYLTGRKEVRGMKEEKDGEGRRRKKEEKRKKEKGRSVDSSPAFPGAPHEEGASATSLFTSSFFLHPSSRPFLTLSGASEHNLKDITVHIPVGAFTVVTGVSGSGKSTLIDETLKRALMKRFYGAKAVPGKYRRLTGLEHFDKVIEIDQSPIGRTPRSNPATYVGFFSEIRELFAQTESAKARGYTAGRFSFNVKGGRCEVCGGDGVQKLEMSFLPDVYVTCEQCGGKRFNAETLEVTYGGKSIADVLAMTVAEAYEFFAKVPSLARKMKTLVDVGLGYIQLGQSATTLSGGEAQRIKLATELSRRATGRTLYLLDEPTTGLHFDDVAKLMKILLALRAQGNTVVVIEHNTDVMKCADWIIDLGPGGGDKGGRLVCEGPVPTIRACAESVTGKFL